jgi:hypothetical protein
MSMYYVTNPDGVVAQIQSLIEEPYHKTETPPSAIANAVPIVAPSTPITQAAQIPVRPISKKESQRHSLDTREKIRDVLR